MKLKQVNHIGVLGMKPLCGGRILNKGIVSAVECP
ncbi:unnamed protein product, partial [marine sediment metagenome]